MDDGFYSSGRHALVIQPENLRRLDEALSDLLENRGSERSDHVSHRWSIGYENDNLKLNMSLSELLASTNRDGNEIISIKASSGFGYPKVDLSLSRWGNEMWKCGAFIEDDEAQLARFKSRVLSEVSEMKPWYSFITKVSAGTLAMFLWLAYFLLFALPRIQTNGIENFFSLSYGGRLSVIGLSVATIVGVVIALNWLDYLKNKYLFPKYLVVTDGAIKRYALVKTLQKWILAPGIVAPSVFGIVSFFPGNTF